MCNIGIVREMWFKTMYNSYTDETMKTKTIILLEPEIEVPCNRSTFCYCTILSICKRKIKII